jgi:hypothetical protein
VNAGLAETWATDPPRPARDGTAGAEGDSAEAHHASIKPTRARPAIVATPRNEKHSKPFISSDLLVYRQAFWFELPPRH